MPPASSTTDPERYQPSYVAVEHVPVNEVNDTYTDAQKREKLFQAETELELDRRGGEQIPRDEITNAHIHAVQNLATYYLVRGASSPDDVTLGELEDGGEQKERHADQYMETYLDLVERMAEAEPGQPGTYFGATGDPGKIMSVNNGPYARRHDLDEPAWGDVDEDVLPSQFSTRDND